MDPTARETSESRERLANRLVWLIATRVLVVLTILFAYILFLSGTEDGLPTLERLGYLVDAGWPGTPAGELGSELPHRSPTPGEGMLQALIGVASMQTLLYVALLHFLPRRPRLQAWIQVTGDLLLITMLLYKFGSVTANLSILYFVVISVASYLLRGQAGLITAGLAASLFAGVLWAHKSEAYLSLFESGGVLAPMVIEVPYAQPQDLSRLERLGQWLEPPPPSEISQVPVGYSLGIHLLGFLTVALFAGHLARDPELEQELEARSADLASLRTFHRDVVQSISSGLAVADPEGRTQSLNRAGEEILGVKEPILLGRHLAESGLFTESSWATLTKYGGRQMVRSETVLRKGDEQRHIGFTLTPLRDGRGRQTGYILIFQDLTEWRRLQERVKLQDRMAALGQMAAGLAHEVGNPLAAISGSAQLLEQGLEIEDPAKRKLLGITIKESQRLDRTVKSFLDFAKPRERRPEPFDVAGLLAEDLELLRNSGDVGEHHELVLDLEPESVTAVADADQISQLFWNLARNALKAMPEGGRLTIRGRVLEETDGDASSLDARLAGPIYRLEVIDQGRGMTEDERQKLFQPFKSFFDSGLGLGMAISYRIVEEHGGEIRVESEQKKGTRIVVDLPLEPPDRAAAEGDDAAPGEGHEAAEPEGLREPSRSDVPVLPHVEDPVEESAR